MVANMHGSSGGSTADFEGFPSSAPRQKAREAVDIGGGTSGASNALVMDAASSYSVLAVDSQGTQQPVTVLSSGSAPPCGGEGADAAAVDSDDAASVHSAMGKAPLSKYMILDPRKLMGKRLPSVLPRNFTRLDHLAGRAESPASMPPSLRPASPGKSLGSRTLYSAMHLDMLPAASGAISSEPTPSSPVHSVGRRDKRAATAGSPLPSVVLTAPDGQDAFAGGGESGD
ncbi:hypothetical protein GGI04_005237 [Coemansia thaxteri]|nr:hypothetical protein GGI04_005237 [Coemansia thaxteri]